MEGEYDYQVIKNSLIIPHGVTRIERSDIIDDTITHVEIPDSVIEIGECAFIGCKKLASITIPKSVSIIDQDAFALCSGLKRIDVDIDNKTFKSKGNCLLNYAGTSLIKGCSTSVIPTGVLEICSGAFLGCEDLTIITIPGSVKRIGADAFSMTGIISIAIPDSVTEIGDHAFSMCDDLTSVKLSDNITKIGCGAFSRCPALKSINIPRNLKTIGNSLFEHCGSLSTIEIPDSVSCVSLNAFSGCYSLKEITIPNSVTSILNEAFLNCTRLATVRLSKGLRIISNSCFRYCESLTDIIIPEGVEKIEYHAFANCKSLKSITFLGTRISLEDYVFTSCSSLSDISIWEKNPSRAEAYLGDLTYLNNNITLHVPVGTWFDYSICERFKKFKEIVSDVPTGDSYLNYLRLKELEGVSFLDLCKSVKRQIRLKEEKESPLEKLKENYRDATMAEQRYVLLQKSIEGYFKVWEVMPEDPSRWFCAEGWSYAFGEGLPLQLDRPNEGQETPVVDRIDWEEGRFYVGELFYSFEILDLDHLSWLLPLFYKDLFLKKC